MVRRMTAAVLAIVASTAVAGSARAATFDVTTTSDGTGSCPASTGSPCTLRAALDTASNTQETDTINLPAGAYTVTATLGDLDVPGGVEIIGSGADLTSVDGAAAVRVFHIQNGLQSRIVNVTVSGGAALSDNDGFGGNIVMDH